jgi:hypothetical protein
LKQKLKRQFDKKENEFYFTDERGIVYLDELSVRKSLFPLKKVCIKDYTPIVKVIDKQPKSVGMLDLSKHKKQEEEQANMFINPFKFKDKLIEKAKKHSFSIFHLSSFVIFIVFWCRSAIFFRNSQEFNLIVNSFITTSNYFSRSIPVIIF